MGPSPFRVEARQPGESPQIHHHHRRDRPGRRVGRLLARRAGLQRPQLLHSRQPAARAQHCRAGRHQCREELPERRRQHPAPVLRHHQGRRLPLAGGQRLPARANEREHHRSMRRAGRAVRAGVRRPAGQSIVRRRSGIAHVLRARPDRPAAAARGLPVDDAAGSARNRHLVPQPRDARRRDREGTGSRHRLPQPADGCDRALRGTRRVAVHRRLRHRVLPLHQRGEFERHRRLARAQARRATSPIPATRRSIRPAFRYRERTSRSSRS